MIFRFALALALAGVAACGSTPRPKGPSHEGRREAGGVSSRACAAAGSDVLCRDTEGGDGRVVQAGFPLEDARTALRAAQGGLRSCGDARGPRALEVALRFETSGEVSEVDVVPAEGAAASCVRARLSEVAILPFAGDPVTLRMPVTF